LPAENADARGAGPAGTGVAAMALLDRDRSRRAGAQLADRRARRAALLLPPHDAARDPRRPRAALLRTRAERPDPAAGVAVQTRRAVAGALASVRRASTLDSRPIPVARSVPLRRSAA